ncbi:short-chain dehydrogenase-like protein 12 [Elsinoe australis]|uniref:Short-chain dehydrogenase-like protein 12 n=1 Tax=Elsinoe australis TaxID=40998 RepID=A0A4U7AY98_9PEZI|nr:short-chain dehydrogenase-like protein 12 [Elsinoe australis]
MFEWLFGRKSFDPDTDIPDLSGKVILVTGGNTGLGKESIRHFVRHNPKKVFLAARTASKAHAAIEEIKRETPDARIEFLQLDLGDLNAVAKAAADFKSRSDRLDILMNNAGIMAVPFALTPQNYDIQFGTNHMGHALLTKLLLPTLLQTAESSPDVRIINLSSVGHNLAALSGGLILDPTRAANAYSFTRYGTAKLANLLHARALRDRYPQLTITSCHPGEINTQLYAPQQNLWKGTWVVGWIWGQFWRVLGTVEDGVRNQLWCAVGEREEVRKGYYFTPVGRRSAGGLYTGREEAERLWEFTERELKKFGFE